MNLHEYQSKELLKKFDLPIPRGKIFINNLNKFGDKITELGPGPWAIKSQIHAGGRGAGYFKNSFNKKGGVQIAFSKEEAFFLSKSMLGNTLITKQTGKKGRYVSRIFVEEGCEIDREFYLSLLVERNSSELMMMLSASGGVDIEDVAETNPKKIHNIYFPKLKNISLPSSLINSLNINHDQFSELTELSKKLVNAFISLDATTIEINPLIINKKGKFVLLDSKITIDDNALFRQSDLENLRDLSQEEPLEVEANEYGLSYIKLDGSIGCMVNGAGLAMATMDVIKQFGEEPANFLDLGGSANKERAVKAFKILQSDENVKSVFINIFGGIVRCDVIANGIVEAVKELNFKLPIVIRFQGTNASNGQEIINKSNLDLVSVDDFIEAAKTAVDLSRKK